MNNEISPFDTIRRTGEGGEYWSARDLMPLLGYRKWQKFQDSIERAMAAAENSGSVVSSEFSLVAQLTGAGNLGEIERHDYHLTRYACYLVAMNGDPRKPEIAAAQSYFAIQTRRAETQLEQRHQAIRNAVEAASPAYERLVKGLRGKEMPHWQVQAISDAHGVLSHALGITEVYTTSGEIDDINGVGSDRITRAQNGSERAKRHKDKHKKPAPKMPVMRRDQFRIVNQFDRQLPEIQGDIRPELGKGD